MPSKKPSKAELRDLTPDEIEKGIRLSHAWEISFYSDGRQVVLPPSVHPDSGELYRWKTPLTKASDLPLVDLASLSGESEVDDDADFIEPPKVKKAKKEDVKLDGFKVEPVDLAWLPISDEVREAIVHGAGVKDRSGYLLKASTALVSAGLTQNEVLTVLTDPETFIGQCGYDHAQTKSRKRAAEWVFKYTLAKVSAERSGEGVFGVVTAEDLKPRKLTEEEMEANEKEFAADRSWQQDLVRGGQGGTGAPQKLVKNVVLIVRNTVARDVIKRDEFAYRDAYSVDTPWGGKANRIVGNDDVARIKYWLSSAWGFEPSDNVIEGALVELACQNMFDPVKEALECLPAWDGVKRLDTWLTENFEAEGDPEYLAQVFRKWMVAMVMRVYQPGAKFDWMPIFEGAQGVGKSSFGRLLVGDKYFLDWLPNLHDKDSALSLQGMWAVEMGELSQFRKNELETIKSFVTRTVDKLRPPYGRRLVESPRRCVFFGTTNHNKYLTDPTGNRRFKPLMVGNLDFKALDRDRPQLFAEAKHLWDTKVESERTMELTGAARIFEKKIHAEKMVEDEADVMREAMLSFVEKVVKGDVNFNLRKFRILDLLGGGGPLGNWRPENRNTQFAAKMLRKCGAFMWPSKGINYWDWAGEKAHHEDPDTPFDGGFL